jgi:hypothetical protein
MFSRPLFCEEKERLLSEFTGAARDYLRLTSAQVLALKNGDVYQFAAQMEAARQRKEEAKEAIFHHRQQYGC